MPYLPPALPMPEPAFDTAPFWAHCNEKRLMFEACAACGRVRHPPLPRCPHCGSELRTWVSAPAEARVYSWTVVHHPPHPAVREAVPYNVVVVEFPGLGDVRLVSNVVDAAPGQLAVGLELRLVWEQGPGGQWLPRFRTA